MLNTNIRDERIVALPIYSGVSNVVNQIIDNKKQLVLLNC
jgi:hypothetical protein